MSYLRPDQEAAEAEKSRAAGRNELYKKGAQTALAIGSTAAGGLALSSRIAPFLSKYINPEMALKGISKLSPSTGEFLRNGLEKGLTLQSGLDFLKDNFSKEKEQKAPDQRNILEQYSPELSQFIQGHIQNGRSPIEAGALAQLDPKFKSIIEKMSKDNKTPFSSILESIFGGGQMAQKQPQQTAPPQQSQQAQPQAQSGEGKQNLMAILQKINQIRGG